MAERLVFSAIVSLNQPRGNKIRCTRRALREALLAVTREAHEIGFLAGQQDEHGERLRPGNPGRPGWMDIRLDNPEDLARHHIRITPVVLKSLIGAGYHCLGDLRWVSSRELRGLYYIGYRTAGALLAIVDRFEKGAEASAERPGPPPVDSAATGH